MNLILLSTLPYWPPWPPVRFQNSARGNHACAEHFAIGARRTSPTSREGSAGTGNKSYLPDAAMANRFNLVVIAVRRTTSRPRGNSDHPLGVCTDAPDSTLLDVR